MNRIVRLLGILVLVLVVLGVVGSFSPRTNPPATATVKWDSPETKKLWDRACADCHSHDTKWPVYAYIAPASILVSNHVRDGRQHFNVSMPLRNSAHSADDVAHEIETGSMPESAYLIMHPEAKLTDAEKKQLIAGIKASLK